ncbi:hypothetical protein PLEOSDRAFT_1109146 [Pleurotus ostreatus PC15]|uniref:Enoyl reductase (ER) domain-containing protein n=1 Tax=Pleurotus ostreatus (strain PC15) TaxID=1137138 RepID=A0A067N649_PLEO1|nr:hypothetical protein PLEOSDRAFT_1109146 [Pleurotus ostreatus PC15]
MTLTRNGRHIFNEVPNGYPIPGQTTIYDGSQSIDLDNVPLNGGFLIRTLDLAVDPYLRSMMDQVSNSHVTPFQLGEPLINYGIGLVLRSEYSEAQPGDHVYGLIPFQEYSVLKDFENQIERMRVLKNDVGLPWSVYLGAAGMPGQTSYMAWKAYAKAKPGDVAFITSGAGTVGSLVIQLAKRDGMKVISCASSEEKLQYLSSLGADVTYNYRTTSAREVLEKEGPIDMCVRAIIIIIIIIRDMIMHILTRRDARLHRYWDNVGGETLEAALDNASTGARFLESGMMSGYNEQHLPIRNLFKLIGMQVTMQGFLVWSLVDQYRDEFYREFVPLLASGDIKYREDITHGLETVGEVLLDVQRGKNFGKGIIHLADG